MTPELQAAVERELAELAPGSLRQAARALSRHYRAGGRSGPDTGLAAYLSVRLPATFAAVSRVLAEVKRQRPDLALRSLLDAGAGPGTASWAATGCWPDLERVIMLDADRDFLALAGRLTATSPHPALQRADFRFGEIEALPAAAASLVIASYALAEIPEPRWDRAVGSLWRAATGILVLVEPGTPAGFARIRRARDLLLGQGAVPVAPCPHAGACPLTGEDWCHFAVRLQRSRTHMHAKGAVVPFEDEPYSYLAVSRTGTVSARPRILAPPRETKPGITFTLCTPQGLELRHVARRDGPAYKQARKRGWGDAL